MSKLESPRRLSSSPQGDKGPPHSLAPPLLGKGSATDTLPLGPMSSHWFPPLLPVQKLEKSPKMSNGKSVALTSP